MDRIYSPIRDPSRLTPDFQRTEPPQAAFKEVMQEIRNSLEQRFRDNTEVSLLVREYAKAIDEILIRAWDHFFPENDSDLTLTAVGGYGRCELHPASDIDIMILLEEDGAPTYKGSIERYLAFLWDIGLDVGHSVRTVADCAREAEQDLTVITNLMEARQLCGASDLFNAMRDATGEDAIWSNQDFFEAKLQEQAKRYEKYHDIAYRLEPNIKEGPGGLRDLQTIGWVMKRRFGAESLPRLISEGILTEAECQALITGRDFLWKVRFALHLLTGRREDRLLFDHQRSIAKQFGYRESKHHMDVEQFMKEYYRTIRELRQLNELLMQLFHEVFLLPKQRAEITPINSRFQARNGFLEATGDRIFKRHPFALLELFLLMQQHRLKGVRAATIRLVRSHLHLINDKFRNDIRTRSLFLEIFKQPQGLTHELRRMSRFGVLSAYLPVFETITGQMQYDLFHIYTVDEHTLSVIGELRGFALPENASTFPLCWNVFQQIPKPELLYLAGMFHDIAKGRGGNHSQLGAEIAREFCLHLHLSQYDANLVAWLVRNHLILSVTAQRQDISDPEVINRFANRAENQVHLNYLYLLTVADIRSTNPKLWNSWKDALLKELYHATSQAIWRGLDNPLDHSESIAETRSEVLNLLGDDVLNERLEAVWRDMGDNYFLRFSPSEIAWQSRVIASTPEDQLPKVLVRDLALRGGTEVFVYTLDQDYLFATATAILGQSGLNVMDARIITSINGIVLDSFIVLEEDNRTVQGKERMAEITSMLRKGLCNIEGPPKQITRRLQRQMKNFPISPRVNFREDQAKRRTIMEVYAADRPGLLSRVALAMAHCGVRLENAKIATFGERTEDSFFLTDGDERPLTKTITSRLREEVIAALNG
ncbi:MAG: [protein-PII] uridylyltransferase [Gammaproteobacteria bacterium]|nr:[protein-PII] uridylyltransferase [Gammaproteobacteria bacterium]